MDSVCFFVHLISLLFLLLVWSCCRHLCSTTVMFPWSFPKIALAIFPPLLYVVHGHRWKTAALVSFDSKELSFCLQAACCCLSWQRGLYDWPSRQHIQQEFCFQSECLWKFSIWNSYISSKHFKYKMQNFSSQDLWFNCSITHVTKINNLTLTAGKQILTVVLLNIF